MISEPVTSFIEFIFPRSSQQLEYAEHSSSTLVLNISYISSAQNDLLIKQEPQFSSFSPQKYKTFPLLIRHS